MRLKNLITWFVVMAIGSGLFSAPRNVQASQSQPAPAAVSAYELILAMNTLRVAYGNPALIEDPIVNAVAQYTAQVMADNQMSWHIGDVRGRIAAAGYGSGGTVWATENFAVGNMAIDQIMAAWADPDHMRPAVTAAYCHIGAGVATANGKTYYVLQAAYVGGQACGSVSSSGGASSPGSTSGSTSGSLPVSQLIIPVKIATPDADGKIYHVVQAGQSFWSIAISYQLTIADLETWNNLKRETPLKTGQRLFIPGKDTQGYATPTPEGMILRSTPDADGRITHEVQAYQALFSISDAYTVSVDRILALNGLQADWPLQIGQKLLIDPGDVTPSPTLSAIEQLTPASDGNYYHTVKSGETLSWIAGLYDVPLQSLMNWNGLSDASIIGVDQKLLLMVTPPVTATFTPLPPTITPTLQPTLTATPIGGDATPLAADAPEPALPGSNWWLALLIFIIVVGLGWVVWILLSRKQ
ncbi:MAG: LysM peptidoglycan-binding domain-containing protein [Anaerolineae bacterium]|nr:LysM peptidoglycan-binding domain-containing protein [Anaerolineae bacterium]